MNLDGFTRTKSETRVSADIHSGQRPLPLSNHSNRRHDHSNPGSPSKLYQLVRSELVIMAAAQGQTM